MEAGHGKQNYSLNVYRHTDVCSPSFYCFSSGYSFVSLIGE